MSPYRERGWDKVTWPAPHNFVIHKCELMDNKMEENNVPPPIQYALIICTARILMNAIMLLQIQAGCTVERILPVQ
jgi:hypothetical protein